MKIAYRVSAVTVAANVALSLVKLAAGIIASSGAMISDALHSASDVLSTLVVTVGIKLSEKEADESHPYGHERFECVSAIVLSVVLCITGVGIGVAGIRKIASGEELSSPGWLALAAAALSIVVKELMYHYTARAAKKIGSPSMKADAWHHRSDALSSVGSFAGVLGAMLGLKILDPIAGIIIAALVVKVSVDIFSDAGGRMTDRSCDDETVEELKNTISSVEGVLGVDLIRTRVFGNKIYVDAEIVCDGHMTLTESHEVAENVHHAIEAYSPNVKHCMVHVNPKE